MIAVGTRMAVRALCTATVVLCAAAAVRAAAPQDIPQITGSERLAWDQPDTGGAALDQIGFLVYVDSARGELPDASCEPAASGLTCSATMPPMSPGRHAIYVAAYSFAAAAESAPSEPIVVDVLGTQAERVSANTRSSFAAGGLAARQVQPVTTDVGEVTGLAVAQDGSLLIADRRGGLTLTGRGRSSHDTSALDDVAVDAGGLLAIAPDPGFVVSRFAFVAYAARGRDGRDVFRIARLREAGGTFGDRVVIFEDRLTAPVASAALKFARDGTLYAAWQNKVTRLKPDGTTPSDQDVRTLELDASVVSIGGLDWHQESGNLWIAVGLSNGASQLRTFTRRSLLNTVPSKTIAERNLPDGCSAATIAFAVDTARTGNAADLLVGCGESLLRVGVGSPASDIAPVEPLLDRQVGRILAIAVAPDGSVYLGCRGTVVRLAGISR